SVEVLALSGYRAQKEGELSLAPGDVVRQVCKGPLRGWLRGELGGHCGLFPERLVQEIPESLRGAGEPRRPRCARRQGHLAKSRGSQRWCKVNFNYNPEQKDELKLQAGEIVEVIKEIEDGWWLGKKNGQLGAFPSNFVELLDSGAPSLDNPDMPSISPDPQRPPKLSSLTYDSPPDYLRTVSHPETYRVLFDYQPEAPDELALRRGDVVKVLRKTTEDKGWWEGESQGRRGVFPDNFVLPPPPLKKLAPRKVACRKSAPIKEPKPRKMVPKTTPSTVKKLVTVPTEPSKAKPLGTPSGDGQKRPSRDPGSSGSFLSGSPGHPGRKRPKTQVSRQCSVSGQVRGPNTQDRRGECWAESGLPSKGEGVDGRPRGNQTQNVLVPSPQLKSPRSLQEEEQNSLSKAPPANKTPTLGDTPISKKTPPPGKTSTLEETLIPDKVPTPEETPTLEEKAPAPENPIPEETQNLEDKTVTPEETPSLEDEGPAPVETLTLEAKAPTLKWVFSVVEGPAPEMPPKDDALDPKVVPAGDEALTLEEVLTPEQVLPEKVSTQDSTQLHHFTPEETLGKVKPLVASKMQPQEEVHMPEDPPLSMMEHPLKKRDNSPLHCESKVKPPSIPAHGKAQTQKEAPALLEDAPWKDEANLQQAVPPKEGVSHKKITPAQKNPQPIKLTPDSQGAHTFHSLVPQTPADRSDREEIIMLKAEVESLRMSLEQMGVQLESKLNSIWEELKSEREKRQWLEVQLKQVQELKTQEAQTKGSIHSQTY
ncbi:PREDICTED: SH3 domain-containing protein 21, partial [Condylura cristata]|uniref:SH3 domain-containing protein 21 n=1 Tax=Condylura cristata TaxID=143302 RepID=UPI0006438D74